MSAAAQNLPCTFQDHAGSGWTARGKNGNKGGDHRATDRRADLSWDMFGLLEEERPQEGRERSDCNIEPRGSARSCDLWRPKRDKIRDEPRVPNVPRTVHSLYGTDAPFKSTQRQCSKTAKAADATAPRRNRRSIIS